MGSHLYLPHFPSISGVSASKPFLNYLTTQSKISYASLYPLVLLVSLISKSSDSMSGHTDAFLGMGKICSHKFEHVPNDGMLYTVLYNTFQYCNDNFHILIFARVLQSTNLYGECKIYSTLIIKLKISFKNKCT